MSHGLEFPPLARPAKDNVVSLGCTGIEESGIRSFAIEARLAGFASAGLQDGSEQWFRSFLSQLRAGECLCAGGLRRSVGGCRSGPLHVHRSLPSRRGRASSSWRCGRWWRVPRRTSSWLRTTLCALRIYRGGSSCCARRPARLPRRSDSVPASACSRLGHSVLRGGPACPAFGAGARVASRSGCCRRSDAPTGLAGCGAGSRFVVLSSRCSLAAGVAGVSEGLVEPCVAWRRS